VSILAEPSVAVVTPNAAKRHADKAAAAYLNYLFSDEAQEVMARLGYRPWKPEILQRTPLHRPDIALFPITAIARDWDDAEEKFFAENGIIDTVLRPRPS